MAVVVVVVVREEMKSPEVKRITDTEDGAPQLQRRQMEWQHSIATNSREE